VSRVLEGRVAVVTGAGQGMGRAFAQRLAEAGATVALAEIDEASGLRAEAELAVQGLASIAYRIDVRDRVNVQAMVDDLQARLGRIDVLVNCAGVFAGGPSEDVTPEEWDRVLGINLEGTFVCCQAVGRVMIAQRSGSIINVGSLTAMGGWAKRACYGTSKAAVVALTQILGVEWIGHGVRVNAVNPGQIETPFNEAAYKAGLGDRQTFQNRAPMRRFGTPEEVAEAVLFLASDDASNVNAQAITIDGGWMAWGSLEPAEPLGI
jgi:3-oxoacyl-[acyl-carrier protein] reductase